MRNLMDAPFDARDPLAEEVLDSLAIEELIAYLEERYGITFEDEEVIPENFSDIGVLADLVDAKRRGAKGARR